MVAHRPDWVISRQRVWGVPIVAFYCEGCEELLARRARWSSTWPASCATGAGADEWYMRAGARRSCPRARAAQVRRRGASARRRTSSTCGSTRAAATPPCSRRGRSCAGRPTSTSRARTSTAAGSTPRCSRRWAPASAPPYQAVLTHGFVVDGEGRKMSKSRRQRRHARGADPEVRRRGAAAVGGLRGLHRGHPPLARDPEPAGRRLPAHPQHLPLPARQPRRLRSRARPASPTRGWTSSTAGPCCASAS